MICGSVLKYFLYIEGQGYSVLKLRGCIDLGRGVY